MRTPRVLIVEDSPEMADLLAISLQTDGIESDGAAEGKRALELAQARPFDLVLLDLGLPDMDGLDVLAALKADPALRHIPVIVITGRERTEDKLRAFNLGAVDYVNKPFNFLEVQARIIATLKRKSAADDAEQAVAQERQRTHEEMLRISRAVDDAGDAIAILSPEGRVTYVNDAHVDFFGLSAAELEASQRHRRLFQKPQLWDEMWRTCEEGGAWSGEVEMYASGDRLAPTLCRADAIRDERRAFLGVVLIFTDITQRKRLEEDLLYLANHDPLTGLHNRRFFLEVLQSAVNRAARGAHSFLLYLDLDNFKVVNNSLDHQAGDRLLVDVARTLRDQLRPGDELARLGGDEFTILLNGADEAAATKFARLLVQIFDESRFKEGGKSFCCTASIGLSRIDGVVTAEDALSHADSACYYVKTHGRNGHEVFRPDNQAIAQLSTEAGWSIRIKDALRDHRMEMWLQPILPLRADGRAYFEALVRLRDPDGKIIMPGQFLSAAENFGNMQQIDQFALYESMSLLAAHPALALSINLSARTLNNAHLPVIVERLLSASNIAPDRVLFEITETAMIQNLVHARQLITAIKQLGCRFALDDFGAGASSMLYLRDLPVDVLKIDGSFIRSVDVDLVNRALVKSINEIAHILGKQTVAEYVVNGAVLQVLKAIGVDYVQGWHVCEPAPPEHFFKIGLENVTLPRA
ncbi:MAG: EAL domain-containing protein [Verrucomicrobia bacterium]|nr:EAL domain-containing protein [Verrucomicrobiota bacterium]